MSRLHHARRKLADELRAAARPTPWRWPRSGDGWGSDPPGPSAAGAGFRVFASLACTWAAAPAQSLLASPSCWVVVRRWCWWRGHVPLVGGRAGGPVAQAALAQRLGVGCTSARDGPGCPAVPVDVVIAEGDRTPVAVVEAVDVPSRRLGRGAVLVDGARIEIERGGPQDNVSAMLKRGAPQRRPAGGGGKSARRNPMVSMRGGRSARRRRRGAAVAVEGLWVDPRPTRN